MAVNIVRDERKLSFRDGKFYLMIDQEQEFDIENVISLVTQWSEQKSSIESFLKLDRIEAQQEMEKQLRAQAHQEVNNQLDKAKKELESVEKGLNIFEPVVKEFKTSHSDEYAEYEKKALESLEKMKQNFMKQNGNQ